MTRIAILVLLSVATVVVGWYVIQTLAYCWFGVLWGRERTWPYQILSTLFPKQATEIQDELKDIPNVAAGPIRNLFQRSWQFGVVFCTLVVLLLLLPVVFLWWAALSLLT